MKILSLILAALLLTGCGGGAEKLPYQQITQDEAISYMENESDYIILDVRTPQEFKEGHIKGAINIPNEEIGSGDIPELPSKDQLILVYCRSGNRSKQASLKLSELGYSMIKEFGGINTWSGEIVTD